MRIEQETPSERCVHCGEKIEADDYTDVHRRYTRHVVEEHDKPATGREASRQ